MHRTNTLASADSGLTEYYKAGVLIARGQTTICKRHSASSMHFVILG